MMKKKQKLPKIKNVFSSLWRKFSKSLFNYLNKIKNVLTNNNNQMSI